MDASTGLVSGLCGLGIVCGGLLLVGLLVVVRLGGRGLLPLLSLWLNRRADTPRIEIPPTPRRRADLRARAQAVDFDSALAAAQNQNATPPPAPRPGTPTSTPLPPTAPDRPWRRGSRNEDEIFGGLLDSDGDGVYTERDEF